MTLPRRDSLHERIIADISARIVSGEWPPGHRIPFENALADAYGCSRMTVNKALSQLARAGMIERRRRSGSFVSQRHSRTAALRIQDVRAEVEGLDQAYDFRLLERRVENAVSPLMPDGGKPVLHLCCLHLADSMPFCLEERRISLKTVPEAHTQDFAAQAPGAWLIEHVPWTSAEHVIRAREADGRTAGLLDIAEGSACLTIERRTWRETGPVTQVVLIYPGGRHALVANFSPEGTRER